MLLESMAMSFGKINWPLLSPNEPHFFKYWYDSPDDEDDCAIILYEMGLIISASENIIHANISTTKLFFAFKCTGFTVFYSLLKLYYIWPRKSKYVVAIKIEGLNHIWSVIPLDKSDDGKICSVIEVVLFSLNIWILSFPESTT